MTAADDATGVVISHPKSGRTWLRLMLAHALAAAPVQTLRECATAVPDVAHLPSPTGVAVTHDPAWLVRSPATVVLLRDPGEILVSYFHHATEHRAADRFSGSFSEFVLSPDGLPALAAFMRGVVERLDEAVPTFVTYDDLLADTTVALTRVIRALGQAAKPGQIAAAAHAGRFETMRRVEATQPINTRFDPARPERNRVRTGRADRGATMLSVEERVVVRDHLSEAVGPGIARLRAHVPTDWAL